MIELLKDLGYKYPTKTSVKRAKYGLFKCFCGKEFKTQIQSIKHGRQKSCGCSRKGLVWGHGINDLHGITDIIKEDGMRTKDYYYRRWSDMLARVYSEDFHLKRPTYRDCSVSKEWLLLSNFKKWMETQEWQGKHLDKDILYPSNKHYSEETCLFVTPHLNTLLIDCGANMGICPTGVVKNKHNSFVARLQYKGEYLYLGSFKTENLARLVYLKAKRNYIKEFLKNEESPKVKKGLKRHLKVFKKNIKKLKELR